MNTLSPQVRHTIIGQWIALGLCMVILMVMYTAFHRIAECQDHYMQADHDATAARVQLADAERNSLARVFEVTTTAPNDREKLKEAWFAHAALLEHNNKLRAENPQPELPKAC